MARHNVDSMTEESLTDIASELPHGSGIDCDWFGYTTKDNLCFSNTYTVVNKSGYSDGYAHFTVKLPLFDNFVHWDNFSLEFNGRQSAYLNQLREYLENDLYHGLSKIFNR